MRGGLNGAIHDPDAMFERMLRPLCNFGNIGDKQRRDVAIGIISCLCMWRLVRGVGLIAIVPPIPVCCFRPFCYGMGFGAKQ